MAEGPKPAPAQGDPAPSLELVTLSQRLAMIRAECFGIGKTDIEMESKSGGKFRIKGHTVEAVLSEVRPLLAKYEVGLTPNLESIAYNGNRCDIIVAFEFEALDDASDRRIVRWAGSGTDNGDKGFSKAGTNALKEMLKKLFLITDRDDAKEEEEKVEHKSDEGIRRADLERAHEAKRAAVEQWAKTFKAALETADNAKDVKRLMRENHDQLTDETLPAVTRSFFGDLIAKRLKDLETEGDQ